MNFFKRYGIITFLSVIMLAAAVWGGYKVISYLKNHEIVGPQASEKTGEADSSKKVVNKPVDKSLMVFSNSPDKDSHEFIGSMHEFYNDTLCYGKLETADYIEQKDKANEILEDLKGITIKDEKLAKDMEEIRTNAKKVANSDNRGAMKRLHRLFHDLDIYFNGYSYHEVFGITAFRGKE